MDPTNKDEAEPEVEQEKISNIGKFGQININCDGNEQVIFKNPTSIEHFKKVLKCMFENADTEQELYDAVEKQRDFYDKNLFNINSDIKIHFTTKLNKHDDSFDIDITFTLEMSETMRQDINKQKLENIRMKRKIEEGRMKVQKELNKLEHDKRVKPEMIMMYTTVKTQLPFAKIKNPSEILNDLNIAKKEYYKYLINIIKDQTIDPYPKYLLFNSDYTKYMTHMTGIPAIIPDSLLEQVNSNQMPKIHVDE